ncbi:PPE domain-containing protein, partial [Mycobacterium tuberculosis]|uniref:PPE domain-containing protein n=1 Tax=Mycobacterium tuberculosis TaxID=1773 RepID=UPI001F419B16
MNFSVLPPEINSGRMFFGAGSGPMLAAGGDGSEMESEWGVVTVGVGVFTSDPRAAYERCTLGLGG